MNTKEPVHHVVPIATNYLDSYTDYPVNITGNAGHQDPFSMHTCMGKMYGEGILTSGFWKALLAVIM